MRTIYQMVNDQMKYCIHLERLHLLPRLALNCCCRNAEESSMYVMNQKKLLLINPFQASNNHTDNQDKKNGGFLTTDGDLCCGFPIDMFDIWFVRLLWLIGGCAMCGEPLGGGPSCVFPVRCKLVKDFLFLFIY